jgi:hypothetical protein
MKAVFLRHGAANFLYIALCLLAIGACTPQSELFTEDSQAVLSFSEEAIVFDTVFAAIPTVTKRLRVYNRNARALRIRQIALGGGQASPYRIIIRGEERRQFDNLSLLGGDSLLVLVSTEVPPSAESEIYLAYDSLIFETNGRLQDVKLITWGENVNHIRGAIACNSVWTAQRPYILYDSVTVPQGCSLHIEAGTRIIGFNGASLHVLGSLEVAGNAEQKVSFGGFRREPAFANVPGQWEGIFIYPQSPDNHLRHALIRNAIIGLAVERSRLRLESCLIQNMRVAGLAAVGAEVEAINCILNNCIERLFQGANGGSYSLQHCTLANYEFFFNRNNAPGTVFINQTGAAPMSISLLNSIFWGNLNDEILFSGEELSIVAGYNIFRSALYSAQALNPNNNQNQVNVAADSLFRRPRLFDFSLPITSPARGAGLSSSISEDFLARPRANPPALGALEGQ